MPCDQQKKINVGILVVVLLRRRGKVVARSRDFERVWQWNFAAVLTIGVLGTQAINNCRRCLMAQSS